MADGYLASTSTTGTLAVGGTRNVTIETVDDADCFKITLQAGYTYQFDMRASASGFGTLSDPFMRVRDSSATSLASDDDGGTGDDARINEFVAPYRCTCYVSAGSFLTSGDTGTNQFAATKTAAPISASCTLSPSATRATEGGQASRDRP